MEQEDGVVGGDGGGAEDLGAKAAHRSGAGWDARGCGEGEADEEVCGAVFGGY